MHRLRSRGRHQGVFRGANSFAWGFGLTPGDSEGSHLQGHKGTLGWERSCLRRHIDQEADRATICVNPHVLSSKYLHIAHTVIVTSSGKLLEVCLAGWVSHTYCVFWNSRVQGQAQLKPFSALGGLLC